MSYIYKMKRNPIYFDVCKCTIYGIKNFIIILYKVFCDFFYQHWHCKFHAQCVNATFAATHFLLQHSLSM